METDLEKQAIQAATDRKWKAAIDINLKLIKVNPKDTGAFNRLARAYLETGQKSKAQSFYSKVLKIDKFNSIAAKSLEQLKNLRINRLHPSGSSTPPPIFLEEPGVTRTINLTRLGDTKTISSLHPGDPVSITPREHCITVVSASSHYLGRLPDDLTSRLLPLLKAGNKYHAWVKSLNPLKIFIREAYRSPKHKNTPSFPLTERLSYAAFTPPELIHNEKPDTSSHEDQEEPDLDAIDLEPNPEE